jgi:hypothetical protein
MDVVGDDLGMGPGGPSKEMAASPEGPLVKQTSLFQIVE